jgi:hypothetical protein
VNNYWCLIDVLIESFDISIDPVIWEGWYLIHMWNALGWSHQFIFIEVPVPSQQKSEWWFILCRGLSMCLFLPFWYSRFRNCSNSVVFLIFNFMTFANSQERESEQIINLLSSEEATTFKARRIALYSALKVELADGNRRQSTCYRSYRSRDVKLRSIKQPVSHSWFLQPTCMCN